MADDEPVDRTDEETNGPEFDDETGNSSAEEFEIERTTTRGEAAALLHDLADGVASGSVAFDDGALVVDIPETLDLEIEYEREDDESEIEVELGWPTERDADDESAASETDDPGESDTDDGEDGASDTDDGEDGASDTDAEDSVGGAEKSGGDVEDSGDSEIAGENPDGVVESGDGTAEDDVATVDADGSGVESGVVIGDTAEPSTGSPDPTESEVVGLVEPSEVARSRARFELYRDRADKWRWRLVHHNGNIIADGGGGYTRKANARKGLESVKRNAPGAVVRENE